MNYNTIPNNEIDITSRNILTIRETVARAKLEGFPIPEHSLRYWVKSGQIPAVSIGKKSLVYWPNVVNFLTCGTAGEGQSPFPS